MLLPGFIKKLLAVFRGSVAPPLILLSVMIGFWIGLMPGWSGLHTALVVVVLVLNVHLGLFLLSLGVGKAAALATAPVLYHVGIYVQDHVPGLLRALSSIPIVGMTFHRSAEGVELDEFKMLWAYFLSRYGAMPVGILIQGEYNLKQGPFEQRVAKVLEVGRFIRQADPYRRAMTVHPWYFGGDDRQAWEEPWYDFIMVQGGHGRDGPPPRFYLDIYGRQSPLPLVESECTYEGIHGYDASVVRHNAYKAIQCGAFGYTYGSHGLWYPNQDAEDRKFDEWGEPVPWWEALARPGAEQMKHLRTCYESVDWWKLAPRPDAVAAESKLLVKAEAQEVFLLYYPRQTALAAEAVLAGPAEGDAYAATWFDPRSGATQLIGKRSTAGPRGLALPSCPDGQDWLLILRRVGDAPRHALK